MTETLNQQLDFQPGENQTLDFLIETYGDKLEKLTRADKLFLISIMATHLNNEGLASHPDLPKIVSCLSTLSRIDTEYLIEAISHQVKTGCYAEYTNNTGK
jgi:hypothetical protein